MRHRPTAAASGAAHADELFRSRLDGQIDLRHPLAKLAQRMPWQELEEALSMTLPPAPVAGGRPALPVRLMAGLLYLKHAHNLSDEDNGCTVSGRRTKASCTHCTHPRWNASARARHGNPMSSA